MLTVAKTNIIINNYDNSINNNSSTKTTHTGLKIDPHEDIDLENNSVTKELIDSKLIIKRVWVWV